jgi:hypothetical protein
LQPATARKRTKRKQGGSDEAEDDEYDGMENEEEQEDEQSGCRSVQEDEEAQGGGNEVRSFHHYMPAA